MEHYQSYFMDAPATYRIRVLGQLYGDRVSALWGMVCSSEQLNEREVSVLEGELADQAALLGVINALYNMGYAVLAVERIADKDER